MSFYDKESEEYKEYYDDFYLSTVKTLFMAIKGKLSQKDSLPQTLDPEKPLQDVLLTLSVLSAADSYSIQTLSLIAALKNYYDNLGSILSEQEVIKNQNIEDLKAAYSFVHFSSKVYNKLNIELF